MALRYAGRRALPPIENHRQHTCFNHFSAYTVVNPMQHNKQASPTEHNTLLRRTLQHGWLAVALVYDLNVRGAEAVRRASSLSGNRVRITAETASDASSSDGARLQIISTCDKTLGRV